MTLGNNTQGIGYDPAIAKVYVSNQGSATVAGRLPVCRFFSASFGMLSSHFYTYGDECNVLQTDPKFTAVWVLEGTAVAYVMPTDANGNCPAGFAPLFRLYNNGMGGAPNHRLTIDMATRDLMVSLGWIPEGNGPLIVFACLPPLMSD